MLMMMMPFICHTLPGQTEGLKGGFKEWVDGWAEGWVVCEVWADRWVEGGGKGGLYRPLLMKQKKKAKICFVIYIGKRFFILFMM